MDKIDKQLEWKRKKCRIEIKKLKDKVRIDPAHRQDYYKDIAWIYAILSGYTKDSALSIKYKRLAFRYMRKRITLNHKSGKNFADMADLLRVCSAESGIFTPEMDLVTNYYRKALKYGAENEADSWFSLGLIYYDRAAEAFNRAFRADAEYYREAVKYRDEKKRKNSFELMYEEAKTNADF